MTGPGQKDTHSSKWDRQEQQKSDQSAGFSKNVTKVLQIKRWDSRRGPFRGFDSPPGRF